TRRPAAAAITHPNLQGDFRGRDRLLRWVRRAISLRASDLLAPWTWHFENEARHPLRLVQLDEVLGTRNQEEFGPRKERVERPGDPPVQGRIGVTEDDPDRPPELLQLGDHHVARPDRGQQVYVQAEEGRSVTRRGVELLVQQRHELTPDVRVADEAPHLPPVHST